MSKKNSGKRVVAKSGSAGKLKKLEARELDIQIPGQPSSPRRLPVAKVMALATGARGQGAWPVVLSLVDQITHHVPSYTPAWQAQFEALNRLQDYPQLEEAGQRCLQHQSKWVPALVAMATALRHLQRHHDAVDFLNRAAELAPGDNPTVQQHNAKKKCSRNPC